MRDKPKLPDWPRGHAHDRQFMYELFEAAVSSIVCCSRAGCDIEGTINDFRQEVAERFPKENEQ